MVRRKANAEKFEKPFEYDIPESAVKTSGITWFLNAWLFVLPMLSSYCSVCFFCSPLPTTFRCIQR